jgi:diguanylate cyclase (GGDEF)-like protein
MTMAAYSVDAEAGPHEASDAARVTEAVRPFQLQRYFRIGCAIGIAVVVVALSLIYRHVAFRDLMTHEIRANRALARSLVNSSWTELSRFLDEARTLDRDALARHPDIDDLHRELVRLTMGLDVVKVKIYDAGGLTVFSTDRRQIGEDQSDSPGFVSALRGEKAGGITFRHALDAFHGTIANRDLVYSYVPLQPSDGAAVEAVLEIYSDVTPLVMQLQRTQVIIGGMTLLGMSLLYVFLSVIVHRADRLLRAHQEERELSRQRILHQAYHDLLTGLPNRARFMEQLDKALKRARRSGRRVALMFIDLDNFKHVNDTFGHAAGDELLRIFATRTCGCLRDSDQLFRIGGDEFTVIVEEVAQGHDADLVARRILDALACGADLFGHHASFSASIGIAVYPDHALEQDGLMRGADAAMYAAKRGGKNRIRLHASATMPSST